MKWHIKDKSVDWSWFSWFKVPVKVEQINNGLFFDNVPRKKKNKLAVNDVIINDNDYDYKTK